MREDGLHAEKLPEDVQDVIRAVVSAIRAVKLYPPNNPIFAQSVKKSFAALDRYLSKNAECRIEVLKTDFAYQQTAAGSDAQLHRGIAGDLHAKGIREMIFLRGLSEAELLNFYTILSQPRDELQSSTGLESLLWEKGLSHARVTMASLGEVVLQDDAGATAAGENKGRPAYGEERGEELQGKTISLFGGKVLLSELVLSPSRFGAVMEEQAKKAGGSLDEQTTRLFESYREAGRQLMQTLQGGREPVFSALAESVLSLGPDYREGLIAKKLFVEHDRKSVIEFQEHLQDHVPNDLHEVLSSRFPRSWTVTQVSTLLMQASASAAETRPPAPEHPLPKAELSAIAREMAEYTPEEMETLKSIGDFGAEPDILDAVVRTLIYVLPVVQNPFAPQSAERALSQFTGIVSQLEGELSQLLSRKDYVLASLVLRAFRAPVAPAFRPRLAEAIKRAGDRKMILQLMVDIRAFSKDSAEYQAVYSYLSLLDREATPVLLEMLAAEEDRSARRLLVRVLKDLGKNQIALLGERLSDERWYFVRNIVSILGESRREEVISYLERVAGHKNFQIRQEVVRALLSIGGAKSAALLIRFLNDKDIDIRFMAIRGLGSLSITGGAAERALIGFLRGRWLKTIDHEQKVEAIASLGKAGGAEAARYLKKFTKIKWWRARKPQHEVIAAARKSIEEIERRLGHAGAR